MNIISWNVNGIRSNLKKGILPVLLKNPENIDKNLHSVDIIGLQETKATFHELGDAFASDLFDIYHNSATERKGYSGTVVYVRKGIKSKQIDISKIKSKSKKVSFETLNTEGRITCVELDKFILINCYFPNGGGKPERLVYKLKFYEQFGNLCKELTKIHMKPVIFCGDLNIAHTEIDLARPKANEDSIGFLPIERKQLDILHDIGYTDVYRKLNPEKIEYTWWDMKTRSRDKNVGWRIDGFYVDNSFMGNIKDIMILGTVLGSDHCPVLLKIK